MASTDEASALKRNTVHQRSLSLELQQLEKDRGIRLREMQKASQAFARRHEEIKCKREKASLRRVTSAPVQTLPNIPHRGREELSADSSDNLTNQPFITKASTLEAPYSKMQVRKSLTMPSLQTPSLRSNSLPMALTVTSDSTHHRGLTPRRVGFVSPTEEGPDSTSVAPLYSRGFTSSRKREDLMIGRAASLANGQTSLSEKSGNSDRNRRKSVR